MFEFIRTHQRLMQFFLLLVIFPTFIVGGVSFLKGAGGGGDTVAVVGDQNISQQDWDAAQRAQIEHYRQIYGARFDPKMLDTPEAKQGALDSLVDERTKNAEIRSSHLTATDAAVAATLRQYFPPGADGKFDTKQYDQMLAYQGLTRDQNNERIRSGLARQQLDTAIESSAFVANTVSAHISETLAMERDVQELLFPAADYLAQVKLTDAMVKDYYEKHAAQYQIPEQVKVEYVVLDTSSVGEQRRASHILINLKKDASAADKAAARAKADAILAEVRKDPSSFARIAKAQSQDTASGELGGDLGTVEKGTLPKPVEDAVFKMKQGEISDIVTSDFGYHIVTVTGVTAAQDKPKDLAETFTNVVFEQPDSLKPAADKLKLKIETIDNLTRTPSPALGNAPFNNPKFLAAVFSDEALKNKRNTAAIDVAPNTLIAGHVVEFHAAGQHPLTEVDAQIRQTLTLQEAGKLAQKAGEAKLAAVKASGDATGFGEVKTVSRTKARVLDAEAGLAVIKADVSKLPAYVGALIPGKGYGVYRIGKVSQPAQVDAAARASEQQQIVAKVGQQETYSYVEALKQKAKVKLMKRAELASTDAKPGDDEE